MSTSTNGQICFGVCFEEDYEFPWDTDEDLDIETWWRKENNYVPPFECWTDEGEVAEGITDDKMSEYFNHRREWDKGNPIPMELVNYCSGDYPMIIIATPSSVMSARRGYALVFNPCDLVVNEKEKQGLKDFCKKYNLEGSPEPEWWLSSYWG